MNGRAKRMSKVATPGLALLTVLSLGATEPVFADRNATSTRSAGTMSRSPSSTGSSSARATAAPSSTSKGSSGRSAVQTRQSTPASRAKARRPGRRDHHFGFGFGYGYYGGYYGRYWPGYYYPYYHYPYYWGVPYYVPRRARTEYELGALDLNVRPKKAELYLDGQYIGKVGQFDGLPGYLWLEGGSYELIFYRPGLATERRVLTVYPGVVVDVHLRMVAGESVEPSEISTAGAAQGPMAEVKAAYEQQQKREARPAPRGSSAELDTRTPPGRLRLKVLPADASVYLDGRFLGSGAELAQLHSGLVVAAGNHLLEVVRPGYPSETKEFSVVEGEEVELEILLVNPRRSEVGG